MRVDRTWIVAGMAFAWLAGAAVAAEPASGHEGQPASAYKTDLEAALTGAAFSGNYVRDGSPYSLHFGADGMLQDNRGNEGRWWVNGEGEYCREWSTGPLAGSDACMEVLIHGKRMAVYSGDERVLNGMIVRSMSAVMGGYSRKDGQ